MGFASSSGFSIHNVYCSKCTSVTPTGQDLTPVLSERSLYDYYRAVSSIYDTNISDRGAYVENNLVLTR